MLEVTVYKGSERQIQMGSLTWSYALAIFFGLLVILAVYIFCSIVYGLGFLGLMCALLVFVGYAYLIVHLSRLYGRGGLMNLLAQQQRPDYIRSGLTSPGRISYLCSHRRKK